MNKFKVNDVVKCEWGYFSRIDIGETYKVRAVSSTGGSILITTASGDLWYDIKYFKLVSSEFDMVNNPWFIRVSNQKEYELAKEFVKSKGFKFSFGEDYTDSSKTITNRDDLNKVLCKGLEYVIRSERVFFDKDRYEIKLNFKTTIDSIEYPEVKSAEELEIEQIETEMRKLADRLNKIKGN